MTWLKSFILFSLIFLVGCTYSGNVVKEFNGLTEVYFCPIDDCKSVLLRELNDANDIKCAYYDLDLPDVAEILVSKRAKLVFDHASSIILNNSVVDPKYSQMHNKFCILDGKTILTGSMNPTFRDTSVNYNNFLVFHSIQMASAYEKEFKQMFNGTFSAKKKEVSKIHDFFVNDETVNVYFCPQDWCATKILYALDTAQESIYFMTFSFTHDQMGELLVKKHSLGVDVRGLFEKSQNNDYSEFPRLNASGIPIKWEATGANLHHKVFIIDKKIVVTGSMNPSLNGDTSNDENVVIIHDEELALSFYNEFERIYGKL